MSETQEIAASIVGTVAERSGRDVLELPRLYDSVDPGALETLVERMNAGEVSFPYAGYDVTVLSDRSIHLEVRDRCHAEATACEA